MTDQPPLCAPSVCTHPPTRLFSWYAHDGTLCIACCDCGEVLAGAAEPWHQITEAEEDQDSISPEDLIFEAKTADGYILGSACIEGFGPLAYANNPQRLGYDTIAFCGHDSSTSSPTASPKPSSCCKNSSPTNGGKLRRSEP